MSAPDPRSGVQPDGTWQPAFDGQRRPFEPGNPLRFQPGHQLSVQTGAYSPAVVHALSQALVDQVLEQAAVPGSPIAFLLDPTYRRVLYSYGDAAAREYCFSRRLAEHGECDGCKRCAAWDDGLRRWQASVANHEKRLGIDPLSRARLGKDVAAAQVDMATLLSAERRRLEDQARTVEGEAS